MDKWTYSKDCQPKKNDRYLVICGSPLIKPYIKILEFSNDLYRVDKYDFYKYKGRKVAGWFDYDSEYGYYEWNNVTAWTELPEIPEELLKKFAD